MEGGNHGIEKQLFLTIFILISLPHILSVVCWVEVTAFGARSCITSNGNILINNVKLSVVAARPWQPVTH